MQTSDERLCVRILLVCMVVQAALALMYALTLRYELKTSGLDGMVYAQLFHNLLEGRGFVSSINPPFVPQHWMGIHFSPILFLMTPFYWLFPHIETFLVIGAVALAAAAWPVYLTARHILDNAGHALIIAFLYLFNPFVFNAIVWDFHEIDFAPLCIAWMLWAVVKKKRYTLLALGAVLMCIKEHYGLAVAGFGALWAWHWRERKLGIWLAIDGLAIMLLIFVIVIPMFNPLGKPMMMNEASPLDRFSWLTSVDSIRHYAWPMLLAALAYAGHLLVPYLLLPLVSCVWLLPGIADIAVNTLAQTPMMRSPLSYHSAALVPVILVALCMSIKTLFHGRTRISANDSMLPIVVVALSYSYMQLALPFSDTGNTWEFGEPQISYTPEDNKAVQAIRGMIPPNAIVTAQENVLPHLNPQHEMYPFPERLTDATYVVLHLKFPYENAANIFGTPYGMSGDRFFSYVDTLLADRNWKTVWSDRQWLVLQKDGVENLGARHAAQKNLEGARKAYRSAYERVTGVAPSS